MTRYLIFSDESGSWNIRNNVEDNYYVRCWITIPSDKFLNEEYKDLKSFFTVIKLSDFYSERYIIRERIEKSLKNIFEDLKQILKEYMNDIKPAILSAVNKVLFLNIYERYCWINFFEGLKLRGNDIESIIIDNPQFNKKEYKKMLLSIDEIELRKSKIKIRLEESKIKFKDEMRWDGKISKALDIADKYSRLLLRIIKGEEKSNEIGDFRKFYKISIKHQKIDHGNILPGIEKVFKGYVEDLKNKLKRLNYETDS